MSLNLSGLTHKSLYLAHFAYIVQYYLVGTGPNLRVAEDQGPGSKTVGQRENSLIPSLSILFRLSSDGVRSTHIKEGNLPYSVC